jgi:hypothetical protein
MIQRLCQGIELVANVGGSLSAFLDDVLQVDKDFIENELPVIFLDGRPVDNPDTAVVRDGSQIALSGSLPGLAGIALRRHSPSAAFRDDITYSHRDDTIERTKGTVTIKLFNTIAPLLGPRLLKKAPRMCS